jgi:hypothetical protein
VLHQECRTAKKPAQLFRSLLLLLAAQASWDHVVRRDQATDDQPTGSSGGAAHPTRYGPGRLIRAGPPTFSERVPENAYNSGSYGPSV